MSTEPIYSFTQIVRDHWFVVRAGLVAAMGIAWGFLQLAHFPDKLFAIWEFDPNRGMDLFYTNMIVAVIGAALYLYSSRIDHRIANARYVGDHDERMFRATTPQEDAALKHGAKAGYIGVALFAMGSIAASAIVLTA